GKGALPSRRPGTRAARHPLLPARGAAAPRRVSDTARHRGVGVGHSRGRRRHRDAGGTGDRRTHVAVEPREDPDRQRRGRPPRRRPPRRARGVVAYSGGPASGTRVHPARADCRRHPRRARRDDSGTARRQPVGGGDRRGGAVGFFARTSLRHGRPAADCHGTTAGGASAERARRRRRLQGAHRRAFGCAGRRRDRDRDLRRARLARMGAAARHLPRGDHRLEARAAAEDAAGDRGGARRTPRRGQRHRQHRRRRHRLAGRPLRNVPRRRAPRLRGRPRRRRQRYNRQRNRQGVGAQHLVDHVAVARAPRDLGCDVARRHRRRHRRGARPGRCRRLARALAVDAARRDRHRRNRRFAARELARCHAREPGHPEQRHAELHQHGGRHLRHARHRGVERNGVKRFKLLLEFSRPFTLVAPALGFVSGAATAYGAAPREVWHTDLILYPLIGSLMAAVLNAGNNALNQIYDLDIDAVNKPKRPLPSGRLSMREAWWFTIGTYVIALVLAWMVAPAGPSTGLRAGRHECFLLVLVAVICTYIYSVPPLRTKREGIWANVTIAIPPGRLLKGAGWSSVKKIGGAEPWYIGAIFGLFLLGASTTKDFADMEGDARGGWRTLPLIYGGRAAAWVM